MKYLIYLLLIVLVSACDKSLKPEDTLIKYVHERFQYYNKGGEPNYEFLLSLTTGSLNSKIEAMQKEGGLQLREPRFFEFGKFDVERRTCSELTCSIVYTVSYSVPRGTQKDSIEVKKISEMRKIDGKWKIESVKNVRSTHVNLDSLDVFGDI